MHVERMFKVKRPADVADVAHDRAAGVENATCTATGGDRDRRFGSQEEFELPYARQIFAHSLPRSLLVTTVPGATPSEASTSAEAESLHQVQPPQTLDETSQEIVRDLLEEWTRQNERIRTCGGDIGIYWSRRLETIRREIEEKLLGTQYDQTDGIPVGHVTVLCMAAQKIEQIVDAITHTQSDVRASFRVKAVQLVLEAITNQCSRVDVKMDENGVRDEIGRRKRSRRA